MKIKEVLDEEKNKIKIILFNILNFYLIIKNIKIKSFLILILF